jgi:hypothetical protein
MGSARTTGGRIVVPRMQQEQAFAHEALAV